MFPNKYSFRHRVFRMKLNENFFYRHIIKNDNAQKSVLGKIMLTSETSIWKQRE
jgi:hypothetical protein